MRSIRVRAARAADVPACGGDRALHPPRDRRRLDRRGAHDRAGATSRSPPPRRWTGPTAGRARGHPRRDASPSRRSRSASGSPTTTSAAFVDVLAASAGAGGALDPLRADVLRRARHRRSRCSSSAPGALIVPGGARARRRARRARARARGHAVRRPHPRRPRRADLVRAQARRLRDRGPPQRRAARARVRAGRDGRDLRRRRHLRVARPGLRGARARRGSASRARAGLHPGRPARPPRRAAAGDRARRRRAGALRDRDPPPPAHRGARGRGAVPRRPEGLERDAAQAQPDRHASASRGLARVLRGYAQAGLENVALWHERDISHSGAERVSCPTRRSCSTTCSTSRCGSCAG